MKTVITLLFASGTLLLAASGFAQPYYAPGSYQGWTLPELAAEMKDDGTGGDLASGDGIYSVTVNIATAGAYQWKAATTGWAESWPGSGNCWFITNADNEDVLLTFDTNSIGDGWAPDSFWPHSSRTTGNDYKIVGTLQDEMGDPSDWDPVGGTLLMHDDGLDGDVTAGDGIYSYRGGVSVAGTHEWKVAVNGGWDQQFGTDGGSVNASTWLVDVLNDGDIWIFMLNIRTGRIYAIPDATVATEAKSWSEAKNQYK